MIRNLVKKGPCVIVGRCADFVLKGRKNVIKVFIYADLDERKQRIEHVYKEAKGKALDKIEKTDKQRASYYEHYTGKKFGEMTNYDMCLNSSIIGIDGCRYHQNLIYGKNKIIENTIKKSAKWHF